LPLFADIVVHTGAGDAVADALRRRLGPTEVFLDNRSIGLGQAFGKVLRDGVRQAAVLLALIGPRWAEGPLLERLHDPADWVRHEILLAREHRTMIIPVLVDRPTFPETVTLPDQLRFLASLQAATLRQGHPPDVDTLAAQIAALLPPGVAPVSTATEPVGVARTRDALETRLRHILPPAQQWSGNRDRLVDLALALLSPDDRLVYLVPGRLEGRQRGSAAVLLTDTDVLVAEVAESFRLRGEIRFPRARVTRVEVAPTLPLFADIVVHTGAGDAVAVLGLFRDQARRLADHLRA
ncbi:MAG TPA: toll/interleukin-1 receptor domain-containing protein, partial [Pseudonocardia sp.]